MSAYQPVSQGRLREESGEIPGDVAYAVGPKEDVNVILEYGRRAAKEEGIEVNTHAREGDPADAILHHRTPSLVTPLTFSSNRCSHTNTEEPIDAPPQPADEVRLLTVCR